MGHQLKAVVQAAIVLAVQMVCIPVGDAQERSGIVAALAGIVDFQLHAEIAGATAVENGVRLVVVIVDATLTAAGAAAIAEGLVIAFVPIVGIVLVDHPSALGAGQVVAVVAVLTKRRVAVTGVLVPPDTRPAVGADQGGGFQTGGTEQLAVEFDELFHRMGCSAGIAVFGFHDRSSQ